MPRFCQIFGWSDMRNIFENRIYYIDTGVLVAGGRSCVQQLSVGRPRRIRCRQAVAARCGRLLSPQPGICVILPVSCMHECVCICRQCPSWSNCIFADTGILTDSILNLSNNTNICGNLFVRRHIRRLYENLIIVDPKIYNSSICNGDLTNIYCPCIGHLGFFCRYMVLRCSQCRLLRSFICWGLYLASRWSYLIIYV